MSTGYFLIIGAIAVIYLVFMFGLRGILKKNHQDAVTDMTADEAMKLYLERIVPGLNPGDFRLLWGSTFANTDITRIYAYNEERILVIPAKVADGGIVMPDNQPSAEIELKTIDHIWFGKKDSMIRKLFVTLFFDAKNDDDNFDIWCEKRDVCGNDNRPDFREFIDFMENWAKKHNIPTEDL